MHGTKRTWTAVIAAAAISVTGLVVAGSAGAEPPDSCSTTSSVDGHASGMPFASGAYHANQPEHVRELAELRGAPLDVIAIFPSRESWSNLHNQWWADTIPPGFTGTLSVGMPMWPEDGNLTTAAAGGYDDEWHKFGADLAATYPTAYVRIGLEMNLPNYWAATAQTQDEWVRAF